MQCASLEEFLLLALLRCVSVGGVFPTYEEDGGAIDYVIKDGHIYTKYDGPDMWLDAGAIKINGNLMEISGVDYEDDNFKAEWVEKYKRIK